MIIAQISDIHASPYNDNLKRLEKALAWLDALEPDCLVVTGDLVDGNWHEGYREIRKLQEGVRWPWLVLPGNSDDISSMNLLMNGTIAEVKEIFPNFSMLCGDVLLIGLDTTVKGEAYGEISEHLPWLGQQLRMHPQKQSLLFMHHHVFPSGMAPIDDVMCKDAGALAEMLSSLPVNLLAICSGHVHRAMGSQFAGIPAYICGSICAANPLMLNGRIVPPVTDAPSLMVHEVKERRLVSSYVSLS